MAPGSQRLVRLASHLAPPPLAALCAEEAPQTAGHNPFDEVDKHPLTWTRALASATTPQYRPGPLSPEQWRGWWEDGWTVVKAPPGAVDYGALQATLGNLLEDNATYLRESGKLPVLPEPEHADGSGAWERLLRRQAAIEGLMPGNTAGSFAPRAISEVLHSEAMKRATSHPSMLEMVRQLTGAGDICLTGNYALRCKPPSQPMLSKGLPDGPTVPWHQDTCVSAITILAAHIVFQSLTH